MVIAPHSFFRFLAENTEWVMTLYGRGALDEAELHGLIARHRSEAQPTVEYLYRQAEELGILERAAHADASFELSQALGELLAWLTHRQQLTTAKVLRAYLFDIGSTEGDLAEAIQGGDASRATLALRELDRTIEKVRLLSEGNRESVVSEAQGLRSGSGEVSAVDRFVVVRRLWERHLEPLRDLVSVSGEMETLLDRLVGTLGDGERRFLAHGGLRRAFARAAARLARMRRAAAEDHLAAVNEIAPLYERLRRDSRLQRGAAEVLRRIRAEGIGPLRINGRLGLTGWRPQGLLSDDKLRARFAALAGYEPRPPAPLGEAPPPPDLQLITETDLARFLGAAVPLEDTLAFVLARWPTHPLTAQLRAFGRIASGAYGPVHVPEDAGPRQYPVAHGRLEAWPLALDEVTP